MNDEVVAERDLENRVQQLEAALAAVLERNRRVEGDKAWEVSRTRILAIVVLTYLLMCLTFAFIEVQRPLFNALVPTFGYYLSTQTIPIVKQRWIRRFFTAA